VSKMKQERAESVAHDLDQQGFTPKPGCLSLGGPDGRVYRLIMQDKLSQVGGPALGSPPPEISELFWDVRDDATQTSCMYWFETLAEKSTRVFETSICRQRKQTVVEITWTGGEVTEISSMNTGEACLLAVKAMRNQRNKTAGGPREVLPEGWHWWLDPVSNEWKPVHEWSAMNARDAGDAWQLEALGKMGPHGDSSKVNLSAPKPVTVAEPPQPEPEDNITPDCLKATNCGQIRSVLAELAMSWNDICTWTLQGALTEFHIRMAIQRGTVKLSYYPATAMPFRLDGEDISDADLVTLIEEGVFRELHEVFTKETAPFLKEANERDKKVNELCADLREQVGRKRR
jgi:hypothetical protein